MYSECTSNIGRCSAGQKRTTPQAGVDHGRGFAIGAACSGHFGGGLPCSAFADGWRPDGGEGWIIVYSVLVKQFPILYVSLFSGGLCLSSRDVLRVIDEAHICLCLLLVRGLSFMPCLLLLRGKIKIQRRQ
jgi:hypothetical protein